MTVRLFFIVLRFKVKQWLVIRYVKDSQGCGALTRLYNSRDLSLWAMITPAGLLIVETVNIRLIIWNFRFLFLSLPTDI